MNTVTKTEKKLIDTSKIEAGDVFSEESHYVYLGVKEVKTDPSTGDMVKIHSFKHLEGNKVVSLDDRYVASLLETADQFEDDAVVEVGVEDKHWTQKQIDAAKKDGTLPADSTVREGDLKLKGMRSIWTDIHTTKVFSVCFKKKGKELTKKDFNAAKEKQITDALTLISSGKITLEDAFKSIQANPVNPVLEGEDRVLRGYKVQFTSTNGFYDVIDMDIEDNGKGSNLRKVNINEIIWLVVGGVKYVVA